VAVTGKNMILSSWRWHPPSPLQ